MRVVLLSPHLTVYEVPGAVPLVTGPGPARVLAFAHEGMVVSLTRPGRYRVATSWSPYWQATGACLARGSDGMIRLVAHYAGTVKLTFDVSAGAALATLAGKEPRSCGGRE